MGRRPKARGRNVHGIFLLDKPAGLTSNDCLQRIKRLFNANRAGHTGSLDKLATGLLPLCLGEATKLSAYLLDADKEYIADCQLGITTSTGDTAGDILEQRTIPETSSSQFESALKQFRGSIEQIPPMYSALKHNGQRLYKLAYQGQVVERRSRPVTIHELECIHLENDRFTIRVRCSKGTYIRTLAEDIGEVLGCGAHILSLRRTSVGSFTTEQMIEMDALETLAERGADVLDGSLLSMDNAVTHLPIVHMETNTAAYLSQGQAVIVPNAPTEGLVRLYDADQVFIGIGHILDDGRVAPKRLFQF